MKKVLVAMLLFAGATAAYGEFYTWKDGRGIAHYTNSIHEIPARYRQKARVLDVATGKLGGPATAQPAQKAPQGSSGGSPQPSSAPAPAAQLTPNGTPTAAPAPPAAPAATTVPAMPPAANPNLPPPSRDAMRRMNRMRARSTGQPEE